MSKNTELTQELIDAYLKEAGGDVGRAVHLLNVQLQALGGMRFQAMSDARDILWRRNGAEQGS